MWLNNKLQILMLAVLTIFAQSLVMAQVTNVNSTSTNTIYPLGTHDPNVPVLMNGNGSLGNSFSMTACGLDVISKRVTLTQRYQSPGPLQPVALTVNELPCIGNLEIVQAFVYAIVEGAPSSVDITVANSTTSATFPATNIGQVAGGKCWGYSYTTHWRADVTSIIDWNGNYQISGLPTNPGTADTDGAALVIIYRDLSATWEGTLVIDDGCMVAIGGDLSHTMNGVSACQDAFYAKAFSGTGDMQDNIPWMHTDTLNGTADSIPQLFFNWDTLSTQSGPPTWGPMLTVVTSQSTAAFGYSCGNDCYSWIAAGLYWRTACNNCQPSANILDLGVNDTAICQGQSVPINLTAQPGYTYTWSPTTGLSNPNIANPIATPNVTTTYVVLAVDSLGCGASDSLMIDITPSIPPTFATSDPICDGDTLYVGWPGNAAGATWVWDFGSANVHWGSGQGPYALTYSGGPGVYPIGLYILSNIPYLCNSDTTVQYVTVAAPPVASIVGPSTVCIGDTVTLTASGGATYLWSPTGDTTASITFVPTGPQTFSVTPFQYTCIGTPATFTVTITPSPSLVLSPDTFICAGDFTQLVANGVGGTGNYTYSWSPNTFISNPTSNNPTVFPDTTMVYYVTVDDGCGLTITDSIIVEEVELPPSSIALLPDSVCLGQDFTASFVGNMPTGTNFAWSFVNGNLTSGSSSGPVSGYYAQDGDQDIIVYIDYRGCTAEDTAKLHVFPPIATSVMAFDTFICYGQSVMLVANATGGRGIPYTYEWSPGVFIDNINLQSPTVNPLQTTTYTVEVRDYYGGQPCSPSNSAVFTVYVGEPIEVVVSPDVLICKGDTTNLSVYATGGNGAPWVYSWTPAYNLNNPTGSSTAAFPNDTQVFYVSVTDNCTSIETDSVLVTVQPFPPPPTPINDEICAGEIANLYGVLPGVGSYINWFTQSTSTIPFNTGNGFITPTLQSTIGYYLTTVDSFGCESEIRSYVEATVHQPPDANFIAGPNPTEIPNAIVSFNANVGAPAGVSSYLWDFGDGNFDNIQNPVHQYQNEGTYSVTLTVVDSNGCSRTILKADYIIVGKDIQLIVPNAFTPNGDGINDEFFVGHKLLKDFTINIFDRWGNLIYTSKDLNFRWNGTLKGEPLPEGTYIYAIEATAIENTPVKKSGAINLIR